MTRKLREVSLLDPVEARSLLEMPEEPEESTEEADFDENDWFAPPPTPPIYGFAEPNFFSRFSFNQAPGEGLQWKCPEGIAAESPVPAPRPVRPPKKNRISPLDFLLFA